MPTLRLDDKRWVLLEEMAVEMTIKTKKPVSVPQIIRSIIDKEITGSKEIKSNKNDELS